MKILFFSILFSIVCLASTELEDYINSKSYLNSIREFKSYITGSTESIIGSNLISISLLNKDGDIVSFKVLKDIPIVITDCDFEIFKNLNSVKFSMDSDCDKYYSKEFQKKYVLDMIKSVEQKINLIYNKGDLQ